MWRPVLALLALWGLAGAGEPITVAPVVGPVALEQTAATPLVVSIRADPSIAPAVNEVLARFARPTVTRIRSGETPDVSLRARCGGFASPETVSLGVESDRSTSLVSHSPCLLFRPQKQLIADEGATLETLAVVAGLREASAGSALVRRKEGGEWQKIRPEELNVGDHVMFSSVPQWTRAEFDRAAVPSRARLVEILAEALRCGAMPANECISRKGVDIALASAPSESPDTGQLPMLTPQLLQVVGSTAMNANMAHYAGAAGGPSQAMMVSLNGGATSLTAAAQRPDEYDRRDAPVAVDQWPYDKARLSAILSANAGIADEVTIGIADGGLAAADGLPLPASVMWRNTEEKGPEPDLIDDDLNTYVDDLFGAGVIRAGDPEASGDIGICAVQPVSYGASQSDRRGRADHGAIVASIAAGLPFRQAAGDQRGMPKILFFRLLGDLCAQPSALNASEAAFVAAMDYVFERAKILVLSYTFGTPSTEAFLNNGTNHLKANDYLLVVSAGNDSPGDIDPTPPCPACIADPSLSDKDAAGRTLVVGAANRDLRISSGSNWGPRLVRLYAPGEATGALDITGQDASDRPSATSWAAPYAALGAGLMRSFGMERVRDIRERLIAASWPVRDGTGRVDPANSGVLNVTMAAAVRHHAIEVVTLNPRGQFERRVYIGTLDSPLASLCPEGSLGPVHSIRFGALSGGRRALNVRSKRFDKATNRFGQWTSNCSVPETIRFTDLVSGPVEFESRAVTHILLPWL